MYMIGDSVHESVFRNFHELVGSQYTLKSYLISQKNYLSSGDARVLFLKTWRYVSAKLEGAIYRKALQIDS